MNAIQIRLTLKDLLDKLFVTKANFTRGYVAMSYTFCFYKNTGEVHIVDDCGDALCGLIEVNNSNCKAMGIWIDTDKPDIVITIKLLEKLSECEALAVAHSLQVLGINICGQCVASLYRNE